MTELRYVRLDVFTDEPFAGNPLAVFLDAPPLPPARMQQIANELALPETTFVRPPETPGTDARVRIYTPHRELPMAGHPTIGTTFALADAGRLAPGRDAVTLGLGVGPTPVRLEWDPSRLRFAWMQQALPAFGPAIADRAAVAAALGLAPDALAGAQLPVEVASSGVPFLYVPLASRAAVDAAILDRTALVGLLRAAGLEELPVYLFAPEPAGTAACAYSRMFAPLFGIPEDPATGGANGPLAAYLVRHGLVRPGTTAPLVNLQGVRMGRPSRIHLSVRFEAEALTEVWIGGAAVIVGSGTLHA